MTRTAGRALLLLLIPAVASAHGRLEIFGSAVELPAPVREAPEKGENGIPRVR